MTTWADFTESAMKVSKEEGYPLSVLLGQVAIETGRDPKNAPGNNWFGIKGSGTAGTQRLATWEADSRGRAYNTYANFAVYNSIDDAIRAYINLIKTNYPRAWANRDNPTKMIQEIKNSGYATDPDYISKVMSTPEFYTYAKADEEQIKNIALKTEEIDPYEMVDRLNVKTGQWDKSQRYPEEYAKAETLRKNREELAKPIYERFINHFNPFSEVGAAETTSKTATSNPSNQYTVKSGDTLWGVAERTLGSGNRWKELGGYTGAPTSLPIGQKLTIPSTSVNRPTTQSSQQSYSTPTKSYAQTNYSAVQSKNNYVPTQTKSYAAPKQTTVKQSNTSKIIQNAINTVKSWFSW